MPELIQSSTALAKARIKHVLASNKMAGFHPNSQSELASLIEMKTSQLSRILTSDDASFTIDTLERIAKALKTEASRLIMKNAATPLSTETIEQATKAVFQTLLQENEALKQEIEALKKSPQTDLRTALRMVRAALASAKSGDMRARLLQALGMTGSKNQKG